jgi:hypothetical protein|nr:MAG TPA: hypothetical protein [Caudoviricetes sp.]
MEIDFKKIMLSPFILKREKAKEIMKAEKKITKKATKKVTKKNKDPLSSWEKYRFIR